MTDFPLTSEFPTESPKPPCLRALPIPRNPHQVTHAAVARLVPDTLAPGEALTLRSPARFPLSVTLFDLFGNVVVDQHGSLVTLVLDSYAPPPEEPDYLEVYSLEPRLDGDAVAEVCPNTSSSCVLLSSLESSDTKVYELQTRALRKTASQFFKVVAGVVPGSVLARTPPRRGRCGGGMPCTLDPTPCALHPTPCTLHPKS